MYLLVPLPFVFDIIPLGLLVTFNLTALFVGVILAIVDVDLPFSNTISLKLIFRDITFCVTPHGHFPFEIDTVIIALSQ